MEHGAQPFYSLQGRVVRDGDIIEVFSPLGWLRGAFEWSERLEHWARVHVPLEGGGSESLIIVLLPGSPCRWPLRDALSIN